MAKGLSPQEQAAKWAANASGAADNYRKGVQKVTSSPTAKAAQQLQVAKQNYAAAVDNGTMAAGLNGVSLQDWQQAASGKGANNYSGGVTAGLPKMQKALLKWVPIRNAIAQQIQNMPKGSYAERRQRMLAMIDGMHAAKQSNG